MGEWKVLSFTKKNVFFAGVKESLETFCQVCWTVGWMYGIAYIFHVSTLFPF